MIGFITFRLEFHLAHLILREAGSELNIGRPTPTIDDLAFLHPKDSSTTSPKYTMHQAHISIVVCGWSNDKWTGYALANTGLDDGPPSDNDEDDPRPDWFAADRVDDYLKDSDLPTWDARNYWLQIVAVRCQLILKEWVHLVRTIGERVQMMVMLDFLVEGITDELQESRRPTKSRQWHSASQLQ